MGNVYNNWNFCTMSLKNGLFMKSSTRQFDGFRRDRYTTYRYKKLESLGKNNFVKKLFKWND